MQPWDSFRRIASAGKKLLKQMWSVYGSAIQNHFGEHNTPEDLSRLQ